MCLKKFSSNVFSETLSQFLWICAPMKYAALSYIHVQLPSRKIKLEAQIPSAEH